jgi:hypothetical protein
MRGGGGTTMKVPTSPLEIVVILLAAPLWLGSEALLVVMGWMGRGKRLPGGGPAARPGVPSDV